MRLADPAFRAGVRAVRSKTRLAQRAVGAMNRRIAERSQQFRETVAPHVAAIRDAQREARAEIRLFPEVREASVRRRMHLLLSLPRKPRTRRPAQLWVLQRRNLSRCRHWQPMR